MSEQAIDRSLLIGIIFDCRWTRAGRVVVFKQTISQNGSFFAPAIAADFRLRDTAAVIKLRAT